MKQLIKEAQTSLIEEILKAYRPWKWHDKAHLGAVHGAAGIVTQVVLSDPAQAPRLEEDVKKILASQMTSGNFPSSLGGKEDDDRLAQVCHGAQVAVCCLLSMRPHFPDLQSQIDGAVQRPREVVWEMGILRMKPSLCHGAVGNALAIDRQRAQKMMKLATEEIKGGLAEGGW